MYKLNHSPSLFVDDKYYRYRNKNIAIESAKIHNYEFESFIKENKDLHTSIVDELESKTNINYDTFPIKKRYKSNISYFNRNIKEMSYHMFFRKIDDKDELLLDINTLAKDKTYCDVDIVVSNNDKIMGYAVDFKGNEFYKIVLYDIESKKEIKNSIPSVPYADFMFSPDSKYVYYTQSDNKMWVHSVWRYCIETHQSIKLYNETDEQFTAGYYFSADENYVIYTSNRQDASEQHFAPIGNPLNSFCIKPRMIEHDYYSDISNGTIYIRSNFKSTSFRLLKASTVDPEKWFEHINFPSSINFEDFSVFKNFINIYVSSKGKYDVYNYKNKAITKLNITNEPSKISEINKFYNCDNMFFKICGYTKPDYVVEYKEHKIEVLWKKPIEKYNEDNYISYTLEVPSFYGEKVPVSCISKKGADIKSQNIYLYGYGAYGISMEPRFTSNIFSVIDRGYIYAIAHVRGGSEKGYRWYLDGKIHNKMNSFLDLITVAEFFKKNHDKIVLEGRSAGGLLVGASTVMRPDLFDKVIIGVPFVDVIATMSDNTIPLTENEYTEWGNPHNKEDYVYMKQYSPIDNIRKTDYPSTLVLGGISDPRVQYWESIKFHKKLVDNKTDSNKHFLKVNLGSGHFGSTNKFKFYNEIAEYYTFILA